MNLLKSMLIAFGTYSSESRPMPENGLRTEFLSVEQRITGQIGMDMSIYTGRSVVLKATFWEGSVSSPYRI